MSRSPEQVMEQVLDHDRLWLFLDYDGTLADLAPTPEWVVTDAAVVALVTRLAQCSRVRVAVVSGRTLSQLRQLFPVPNILLAGTYGVEMFTPEGELVQRADRGVIRPVLEQLKSIWQPRIADRSGFFLEDKGWALALHARYATEAEADQVLADARLTALRLASVHEFHVLQGQRFLEVGPAVARKGRAVSYILDRFAWPGALPVYLGDDDQDEDAFETIKVYRGVTLVVSALQRKTLADARLTSPQAARDWLDTLAEQLRARTVA